MKTLLKICVLCTALCVPPPAQAAAQELTAGGIRIETPWSRATPGGARVGAGYLKITNTGAKADRLIAVESAIAGRTEIHSMTMDGGIMRMRRLAKGLELPPGKAVELRPGGYHLMFRALKLPIEKGKPFTATLFFQNSGKLAVAFTVEGIGAMKPADGPAPKAAKAAARRGSH